MKVDCLCAVLCPILVRSYYFKRNKCPVVSVVLNRIVNVYITSYLYFHFAFRSFLYKFSKSFYKVSVEEIFFSFSNSFSFFLRFFTSLRCDRINNINPVASYCFKYFGLKSVLILYVDSLRFLCAISTRPCFNNTAIAVPFYSRQLKKLGVSVAHHHKLKLALCSSLNLFRLVRCTFAILNHTNKVKSCVHVF